MTKMLDTFQGSTRLSALESVDELRELRTQAQLEELKAELAASRRHRKWSKVVKAAKVIGFVIFVLGILVALAGPSADCASGICAAENVKTAGNMMATGIVIWVISFIAGFAV